MNVNHHPDPIGHCLPPKPHPSGDRVSSVYTELTPPACGPTSPCVRGGNLCHYLFSPWTRGDARRAEGWGFVNMEITVSGGSQSEASA